MSEPHYSDDWLTIYVGDARGVLAALPAESVDCVVTSPPYWGLRDYGTATWTGGDPECDHKHGRFERSGLSSKQASNNGSGGDEARHDCPKCGAVRQDSQLGLERTPEEYVANLVAVFAEVRRVLKPSGTCWLNLGDTFAANRSYQVTDTKWTDVGNTKGSSVPVGLKPKDLVGIPWRVAFALQADGWYLRSDIIWSKPNPMPESVTDRPTKSHEYLFLLTKSARYYYDADAVREALAPASIQRINQPNFDNQTGGPKDYGSNGTNLNRSARKAVENFAARQRGHARPHQGFNEKWDQMTKEEQSAGGRNLRSVWTIATRPYPGAHFAVFPPEIPERCIKAGSSERGVCQGCGAPWERVVEVTHGERDDSTRDPDKAAARRGMAAVPEKGWESERTTTGWRATCAHDAPVVPSVTLDPFGGSGTVGMVAQKIGRRAILIDLNPEYLKQQIERNAAIPLGLEAA